MKKVEVANISKDKMKKFLFTAFELTNEENEAFHGVVPMKRELFFSIADKCMKAGSKAEDVFDDLLIRYPDFTAEYSNYLDEKFKSGEWKKL